MDHLVSKAFEFARRMHSGQRDKGGVDYIFHPLRVAGAVAADGGDREEIAAAFLHDVVEDTEAEIEEIYGEFGERVGVIVDCLTRRENQKYADYIDRLCVSESARRVKRADVNDNLRDPFPFGASMRRRYEKTLATLDELDEMHGEG